MAKGYKGTASGSGANIMIRHVLSNIGDHIGGFSKEQWVDTKNHFDNKCAYTGEEGTEKNKIVREHVISHNQNDRGLHIYGNIVPATSAANAAKLGKSIDDFMVATNDFFKNKNIDQLTLNKRKEKIIKFQEDTGYTKIHSSILSVIQSKPNDYYKEIQAIVDRQTKEILDIINLSDDPILIDAILKTKLENQNREQGGLAFYIRTQLKELVDKNLINETMLSNLLLKDYSSKVFGISFPFFSKVKVSRYNKTHPFEINNENYYVTSEWDKAKFDVLLEKFEKWRNEIAN